MKMIQIRNVPDDIHRTLKSRAAEEGLSLSDYLLRAVRHEAERPRLEDVLERIRSRRLGLKPGAPTSAEIIREMRGPLPPE